MGAASAHISVPYWILLASCMRGVGNLTLLVADEGDVEVVGQIRGRAGFAEFLTVSWFLISFGGFGVFCRRSRCGVSSKKGQECPSLAVF